MGFTSFTRTSRPLRRRITIRGLPRVLSLLAVFRIKVAHVKNLLRWWATSQKETLLPLQCDLFKSKFRGIFPIVYLMTDIVVFALSLFIHSKLCDLVYLPRCPSTNKHIRHHGIGCTVRNCRTSIKLERYSNRVIPAKWIGWPICNLICELPQPAARASTASLLTRIPGRNFEMFWLDLIFQTIANREVQVLTCVEEETIPPRTKQYWVPVTMSGQVAALVESTQLLWLMMHDAEQVWIFKTPLIISCKMCIALLT